MLSAGQQQDEHEAEADPQRHHAQGWQGQREVAEEGPHGILTEHGTHGLVHRAVRRQEPAPGDRHDREGERVGQEVDEPEDREAPDARAGHGRHEDESEDHRQDAVEEHEDEGDAERLQRPLVGQNLAEVVQADPLRCHEPVPAEQRQRDRGQDGDDDEEDIRTRAPARSGGRGAPSTLRSPACVAAGPPPTAIDRPSTDPRRSGC